jgi:hypothetical protein
MALRVAELLAGELGRDTSWKGAQVAQFNALAFFLSATRTSAPGSFWQFARSGNVMAQIR